MNTLESNRTEALKWANAMREEFNLPPLDELLGGDIGSSRMCALGNTLNADFTTPYMAEFCNNGRVVVHKLELGYDPETERGYVDITGSEFELPVAVATFEHDFERGFYPDLVEGVESPPNSEYDEMGHFRSTADDSPLALA